MLGLVLGGGESGLSGRGGGFGGGGGGDAATAAGAVNEDEVEMEGAMDLA